LNAVKTLLKLPNLPITKTSTSKLDRKKSINAHFKSIKSPKFTAELDINLEDSVYRVKESLITEVAELKGFATSQIKFLIKGKVIQDSSLIGNVVGEEDADVKFTVMISGKPEEVDQDPEDADIAAILPETEREVVLPWADIAKVLKDSGITDVEGTLLKLQKGWELANK
jgi:hypothetical protein